MAGTRLEALLNAGFPAVYELPPDADDEAMMELAIALSLQEQGEEAALGLHHLLGEAIENGGPVDEGERSSSSASGKGGGGEWGCCRGRDSSCPGIVLVDNVSVTLNVQMFLVDPRIKSLL